MIIILMGPCGSGKTTIGELLSKKLTCNFYDGDDYHAENNISKMKKGIALNDRDRMLWLKNLSLEMEKWKEKHKNTVLACSALKENYRKILGTNQNGVKSVFLTGSYELLEKRLTERSGHYAKANLLKSQLDIQQLTNLDIIIDVSPPPHTIIEIILNKLGLK